MAKKLVFNTPQQAAPQWVGAVVLLIQIRPATDQVRLLYKLLPEDQPDTPTGPQRQADFTVAELISAVVAQGGDLEEGALRLLVVGGRVPVGTPADWNLGA